jgi:hypothetical protein
MEEDFWLNYPVLGKNLNLTNAGQLRAYAHNWLRFPDKKRHRVRVYARLEIWQALERMKVGKFP